MIIMYLVLLLSFNMRFIRCYLYEHANGDYIMQPGTKYASFYSHAQQ